MEDEYAVLETLFTDAYYLCWSEKLPATDWRKGPSPSILARCEPGLGIVYIAKAYVQVLALIVCTLVLSFSGTYVCMHIHSRILCYIFELLPAVPWYIA